MNTPTLSQHDSAGAGRPDRVLSVTPTVGTAHSHSAVEVGKRLRLLREALKMKQTALCRLTGIGDQVWNNAETGDNLLTVSNAAELCRVTGVTMDWIYRGQVTALPSSLLTDIVKATRASK